MTLLDSRLAVSPRRRRRFSPPRGFRPRSDPRVEPAGALAIQLKISAFGGVKPPNASLDTRGAISVEYLVAFLPVMFFFASVWQLADLYAAQLIVQRAASAAGRAASVVLPDDPYYYDQEEPNQYAGQRRRQVELAANLVLDASARILASPDVTVEGHSGSGPLRARVEARYLCFPGWGVFVCGADGEQTLSASARFPYHGADYQYP